MLNTLPAPSAQVARNNSTVALADLVKVVRAEHLAVVSAFSSAVEHALAAGRALIEAKDLIGHGGWTKFLKDCDVGERTTRRYMQLAALAANRSSTTDLVGLTIEGAIKKLAPKAPAAWSKKPTPAAKPEETGRAVTPGDEALLGFTACFCDLLRRIRGRQPSRFARTAVASDDLNKLSKFLTELAQLKAAVPGRDPNARP